MWSISCSGRLVLSRPSTAGKACGWVSRTPCGILGRIDCPPSLLSPSALVSRSSLLVCLTRYTRTLRRISWLVASFAPLTLLAARTHPNGITHISLNFSGVNENATLLPNNAGVANDTSTACNHA